MEQGERLTVRHSGSKNRDIGEILTRERAIVKVEQFIENFTIAHDEAAFQRTLNQMRNSTERQIEVSAEELLNRAKKHFGLTLAEQKQALEHLLIDEDLTAYGLMNAITRTAHDPASYDRASELEAIGSRVLNVTDAQWRELAIAP
jgi:preprotein translocase subunit SecA